MFVSRDGMTFYEVLEVPSDAPQTEIHRSYQRAKATYSQDNPALYSMFTRDEARDLLKLIEEAYSVLGNHALRKSYDESLRRSIPSSDLVADMVHNKAHELSHNSLPDLVGPDSVNAEFMVPDPSIPGSIDLAESRPAARRNVISPPQFSQILTPPTPAPESVIAEADDYIVRKRETSSAVPKGTGKCPMGTYPLNEEFEKEISDRTEFDGPFLQRVRKYKQVPLEKLSEASRIGKTYLIALESNDFKNLPAPVYLRGFLVQIARQLGLNEGKVTSSYMKLAKSVLGS